MCIAAWLFPAAMQVTKTEATNTVSNNEKGICIITPQTRFTNTKIDGKYWISYKDGNLYAKRAISGSYREHQYKNKLVLKNVKTIYDGRNTYFAIQNNGILWAWGNNEYGQIGDNSGINRDNPVKIMDDVKDVQIYSEYATCRVITLKNDGTVYMWGGSGYGGKQGNKYKPEKIELENVSYIYTNDNTFNAFTLSGDHYQWRDYLLPKTPYKDKDKKPLWGKKQPIVSNTSIAIEQINSYGGSYITKDGDLYSWGDVTGNGTNVHVPKDSPILVLQDVKQICSDNAGWSGSKTYRYALCADGNLYTVDIEKTFKYVLVSSNVYLLENTYDVRSGIVSYYTNDGCIYKYHYGGKPKRTDYDVALPQIKNDETKIVEYTQEGYIQDIGNYFGISDVNVVIIGILFFVAFIILCIIFPAFRKIVLRILGIVTVIAVIVAVIYAIIHAIIFIVAIIFILLWLLGGGLGRQWDRDH
jgi:hypothetical protein